MNYVLTGEFQSDRIEAEFGIYRLLSGGNFHISVTQVFNSLNLQRLINGHVSAECCTGNLSDAEVDLLNSCFDNSSVTITETERSSLYYICGYVAHKENGMIMDPIVAENNSASEFTKMVSRGRLSFPTEELFDLYLYMYVYYKSVEDKKCTTRLINAVLFCSATFCKLLRKSFR